jgi:hypothetical protein
LAAAVVDSGRPLLLPLHFTFSMESNQSVLEFALALAAVLGEPRFAAAARAVREALDVDAVAHPAGDVAEPRALPRPPAAPQQVVERPPAPLAAPQVRAPPSTQEECDKVFAIRNKREDMPMIVASTPAGWGVAPGLISPGEWMEVLHNNRSSHVVRCHSTKSTVAMTPACYNHAIAANRPNVEDWMQHREVAYFFYRLDYNNNSKRQHATKSGRMCVAPQMRVRVPTAAQIAEATAVEASRVAPAQAAPGAGPASH